MVNLASILGQVWLIGFVVAAFVAPTWAHSLGWPLWVWKAVMG